MTVESEDTFFFVDVLLQDFGSILEKKPVLILELGCGSGYISTYILKLFETSQKEMPNNGVSNSIIPFCLCVDLNLYATQSTLDMVKANQFEMYCDSVRCDMFECFNNTKFDLIMFNPPYVPGNRDDVNDLIDLAWNGGKDGSEIIKKFLEVVDGYMADEGCVYLLIEKRNDVDSILEIIMTKGFKYTVGSRVLMIDLDSKYKDDNW